MGDSFNLDSQLVASAGIGAWKLAKWRLWESLTGKDLALNHIFAPRGNVQIAG
jgi:hypothetical protein